MAGRIIRGYWDCSHCGTKGIDGLVDICPGCGSGKDKNVRYYMKEVEEVTENELESAGISAGESDGKHREWVCAYCGNLNNYKDEVCVHCGALKEEKEQEYGGDPQQVAYRKDQDGTLHQTAREEEPKQETYQTREDLEREEREHAKAGGSAKKGRLFLLVAALLVLAFLLWPHTYSQAISGFAWERAVTVEELRTFAESGWELPAGARKTGAHTELYNYRQVLDHYETVYKTRSRQVLDHYDVSYEYTDNGNGTFSEHEVRTPVYATEYYKEPVQEPVYRNEPVYRTKYEYEIDRWVADTTYRTSGEDHDPYWSSEYTLKDRQRDTMREEAYYTLYNDETKRRTNYDAWVNQSVGDGVYVTRCRLGLEYSRREK